MTSETFVWSTVSCPAFVSEGPSRWYFKESCSAEAVRAGCGRSGLSRDSASGVVMVGEVGAGGKSNASRVGLLRP